MDAMDVFVLGVGVGLAAGVLVGLSWRWAALCVSEWESGG